MAEFCYDGMWVFWIWIHICTTYPAAKAMLQGWGVIGVVGIDDIAMDGAESVLHSSVS